MRRLFAALMSFLLDAVLSAGVVAGGSFLAALGAMGGMEGRPQGAILAGSVLAGILLPAMVLRRHAPPRPAAPCPRNGHAFEEWVADRLEADGWRVRVTAGSGDQGLDIIARRRGRRIGIQCKRYKGAVGNKAVQEAFSGRAFHRVDVAVVVTTGRYTESARALSRRTGVHLLHVSDLGRLDRLE